MTNPGQRHERCARASAPPGWTAFVDTAQNEELGRLRGWTENIFTARRWRRRGLARALVVESIRELAARGMTEVALGVHTENRTGPLL